MSRPSWPASWLWRLRSNAERLRPCSGSRAIALAEAARLRVVTLVNGLAARGMNLGCSGCASQFERSDERSLHHDEEEQKHPAADHDPGSVQRAVEIDQRRDQPENHAAEKGARHRADPAGQERAAEHDRSDRRQFVSRSGERIARRRIERINDTAERTEE